MRRIWLLPLALCLLLTSAFAEDVSRSRTFTATGIDDAVLTTRGTGVYNHRLTWTGQGTRTSCTIKVEQSDDSVTFTDLIAAQNCATDGATTTTGYANYVRIRVTALTGAGNIVYARYDGTPVAPSAGSVTVSGTLDTNLKQYAGAATDGTGIPIKAGSGGLATTGTDDITKLGGTSIAAVGDAIAGKPLPVAAKAIVTQAAAVDAGDSTYLMTTTDGRLLIKEAAAPQDEWQYTAVIADNNEFTIKAGEANYYLVVTAIMVINSHASVGTTVTLKNATGGTVIYQGYAASGGGGWSQGNGVGSLFIVPTVGNGLFGICGTTGSSTAINIRGYKTKIAP
jgi:hypothetical protein